MNSAQVEDANYDPGQSIARQEQMPELCVRID